MSNGSAEWTPEEIARAKRTVVWALRTMQSPAFQEAARAAQSARAVQIDREALRRTRAVVAATEAAAAANAAQIRLVETSVRAVAEHLSGYEYMLRTVATWASREDVQQVLRAAAERVELKRTASQAQATLSVEELASMADSGDLDAEVLEQFEAQLSADAEMDGSIEAMAEQLTVALPRLSHERARRLIVILAYVVSTGVMLGMSLVPLLGALPGILGIDAPKAAKRAGEFYDRRKHNDADKDG